LPLHDHVSALKAARRNIEQSTKDVAGDAERKVGEHAVRSGWKRHIPRIGVQHGDVAEGRKPPNQDRHELGIELDCQHLSGAFRQRTCERAATRSELDHQIVACDAGVGDELRRES
jgi:hypothetical protein